MHLPFLLKASSNRKYESDRMSTLESPKESIDIHNVLRYDERLVLKMYEMADY